MQQETQEQQSRALARRALVLLTLVNLFNYLDRYVVSALVESLRLEMSLTDTELGWLMTGFVIVYTCAAPIFGHLGDVGKRTHWMALGVAVWSLATAASGLARNFVQLFVARAAVGIGEAAYGTIAPAMLSDHFPKSLRSRILSIFFMAIPVGSALGYVAGGLLSKHFGWRPAFWIVGAPGILLAMFVYSLVDAPRGQFDTQSSNSVKPGWSALVGLLKNRAYLRTVLGYSAYTFGLGGLAFWMPAFLQRMRGMPQVEATVTVGAVAVLTGFVGTFLGGLIADTLARRTPFANWWVAAGATLLAVPFTALMLLCENKTAVVAFMALAELCVFASTGPVNSAILGTVPASLRATATALSIFLMHLFGDVPSPPLIGWLSDGSTLGAAMLIIPVAFVVAGLLWLPVAWPKMDD